MTATLLSGKTIIFTKLSNMNNKLNALLIGIAIAISSCDSSTSTTTSVVSIETDTDLIVGARYPESENPKVEAFLDSAFKQKISLDDDVDLQVKLNDIDKVNIKSSEGQLEIIYSKKDSTSRGNADLKRLSGQLSKKLVPNL